MRTALVIGLSTFAFIGGLTPSEARFRLRLSPHVSVARPTHISAAIPVAATPRERTGRMVAAATLAAPLHVRTAEALAPDEIGGIGIPTVAPTPPVAAPVVKKESAPWCPSGQVTGSGAGFCIIN